MRGVVLRIFRHRALISLIAAIWVLMLSGGLWAVFADDVTPGLPATIGLGGSQPATAVSDKPTLLMFLHPQCPCSQASVQELAKLVARAGDHFNVRVELFCPKRTEADWKESSVWEAVQAIPNISVHADLDARLARRFGARTSGQIFLFDRHGNILYSGGITASRGCSDDNDALRELTFLILQPPEAPATIVNHPVFGCALYATKCPSPNLAGTTK